MDEMERNLLLSMLNDVALPLAHGEAYYTTVPIFDRNRKVVAVCHGQKDGNADDAMEMAALITHTLNRLETLLSVSAPDTVPSIPVTVRGRGPARAARYDKETLADGA